MSQLYLHIDEHCCEASHWVGKYKQLECKLSSSVVLDELNKSAVVFSGFDANNPDAGSIGTHRVSAVETIDGQLGVAAAMEKSASIETATRYVAALLRAATKRLNVSVPVHRVYVDFPKKADDTVSNMAVAHAAAALQIKDSRAWTTGDHDPDKLSKDYRPSSGLPVFELIHDSVGLSGTRSVSVIGSTEHFHCLQVQSQADPRSPATFQLRFSRVIPGTSDTSDPPQLIEVPISLSGDRWDCESEYLVQAHREFDGSYHVQARVGARRVALAIPGTKNESAESPTDNPAREAEKAETVKLALIDDRVYRLTFSPDHRKHCELRRAVRELVHERLYFFDMSDDSGRKLEKL